MHRVLGNRDNLMIRLTLEFKDTGPCLSLTKKISELVPVQGNREAVCHLVLEFIKELPQLLFPYIIPSSRIKPHTAVCRPSSVVTWREEHTVKSRQSCSGLKLIRLRGTENPEWGNSSLDKSRDLGATYKASAAAPSPPAVSRWHTMPGGEDGALISRHSQL